MQNKTLIVSVYGRPPFIIDNPDDESITGTDIKVVELLSEVTGFILELNKQNSWYVEHYDENGTFTGISGSVGVLMSGGSQMAGAEINFTPGIVPYVDYMFHYYVYSHYKTGKPKSLPPYKNMEPNG